MVHFCYVVNGTGGDVHTDMAYLSARFLRVQHPEARITCLMDRDSATAIRDCRHPLLSLVYFIVELDVPESNLTKKNRWISTQVRDFVDGDFIYLDSDTICIRRLDFLSNLCRHESFDVGLTRDLNIRFREKSRKLGHSALWPQLRAMGWTVPACGYFNKGVALLRDTPRARAMSSRWHELWKTSCATGRYLDQPALNHAIVESGAKVRVLPGSCNAQILGSARAACRPKVIHFYTRVPNVFKDTVLGGFLEEIQHAGALSDSTIQTFLHDPFPWTGKESFMAHCWKGNRRSATWFALSRLLHGRPCFSQLKCSPKTGFKIPWPSHEWNRKSPV